MPAILHTRRDEILRLTGLEDAPVNSIEQPCVFRLREMVEVNILQLDRKASLDVGADQAEAERRIVEEAKRAEVEDEVDAVILGCAGMVNVTNAVRQSVRMDVIDPAMTAAGCMKWLH